MQHFGSFWDEQPIWCCEDLFLTYSTLRWPSFSVPCVYMQSLQSSPLHRPRELGFDGLKPPPCCRVSTSYYCIYLYSLNQSHVGTIWKRCFASVSFLNSFRIPTHAFPFARVTGPAGATAPLARSKRIWERSHASEGDKCLQMSRVLNRFLLAPDLGHQTERTSKRKHYLASFIFQAAAFLKTRKTSTFPKRTIQRNML